MKQVIGKAKRFEVLDQLVASQQNEVEVITDDGERIIGWVYLVDSDSIIIKVSDAKFRVEDIEKIAVVLHL